MSGKPLSRVTCVATRSREQNAELARVLGARGAEVVELPTIRFEAAVDSDAAKDLVTNRECFTHIVFTSPRAVEFFRDVSLAAGIDLADWSSCGVAAVGPSTAHALAAAGLPATLRGSGDGAAALAKGMLESGAIDANSHVLVPQSAIARPELVELLSAAGVSATSLVVYRTVREADAAAEQFLAQLQTGQPLDAIVFASPSAVESFLAITGEAGARFLSTGNRPDGVSIVSIGATTSRSLSDRGFAAHAEATSPSPEGLADALTSLANRLRGGRS